MKNSYFAIGEGKCGTTSLNSYLNLHPDIVATKYLNDPKKYKSIAKKYSPKIFIDNSPKYFRTPDIPSFIKSFATNPHMILSLRNPVDRIYSGYHMHIKYNGLKIGSFEEAIQSSYLKMPVNNYYENLLEWYKHFDKQDILIIKAENLFDNPNKILNEIFTFVGVESMEITKSIRMVPHKGDLGKKSHYPPMKKETREWLKEYFKPKNEKLYNLIGRDFNW